MSSQTTSIPQKAPKRRRKPKYKSGSSDFFSYSLGESWQDFLRICGEYVIQCSTHQLQWAWHDCSAEYLHSITCVGILYPKIPPLRSEPSLYFASPIRRSTSSLSDKTMEGILTSLFQHLDIWISFAIAQNWLSDFPQSRSAKLQRLVTDEDEQRRNVNFLLRWLKTVSRTFQNADFDES